MKQFPTSRLGIGADLEWSFSAFHGLQKRLLARQKWNLATRGSPTPPNA